MHVFYLVSNNKVLHIFKLHGSAKELLCSRLVLSLREFLNVTYSFP